MGRRPKIPFPLAVCLGEEKPTRRKKKKEKVMADTKKRGKQGISRGQGE